MRTRWPHLFGLAAILSLVAGCNIIGALLYLTAPPQMQDAEIEVTKQRLAVIVDYAHPDEEHPVFTRAFRDRLVELLREKEVNDLVIPQSEVLRLKRDKPEFRTWSVQQIGRELHAEQVLYVFVEKLQMRDRADSPLLMPQVSLRMKLIAPWEKGENTRLWPPRAERKGREIKRGRPTREATDAMMLDSEASKLGRDAAWLAAKPFYKFDLEEKDPWER